MAEVYHYTKTPEKITWICKKDLSEDKYYLNTIEKIQTKTGAPRFMTYSEEKTYTLQEKEKLFCKEAYLCFAGFSYFGPSRDFYQKRPDQIRSGIKLLEDVSDWWDFSTKIQSDMEKMVFIPSYKPDQVLFDGIIDGCSFRFIKACLNSCGVSTDITDRVYGEKDEEHNKARLLAFFLANENKITQKQYRALDYYQGSYRIKNNEIELCVAGYPVVKVSAPAKDGKFVVKPLENSLER